MILIFSSPCERPVLISEAVPNGLFLWPPRLLTRACTAVGRPYYYCETGSRLYLPDSASASIVVHAAGLGWNRPYAVPSRLVRPEKPDLEPAKRDIALAVSDLSCTQRRVI